MNQQQYFNPPSDDEDDDEFVKTFGGRDGVIFLIDAGNSMFDEHELQEACFRTAIHCVEVTMMNRIITSEKDLIGVVFFNTKNSPPPKDDNILEPGLIVPKNVAIFMPINASSKNSIEYIKNFRASDDFFDFSNKYGHSNGNFADALWLCSRMFIKSGYKLQSSTIVIFTDNHQPHQPGTMELQQSFAKAKDLQQLGVDLILIPMTANFDGDLFFKEFISTVLDSDMNDFEFPKFTTDHEVLLHRIFRRDYRKRCSNHLKISIGGKVEFGAGLYSFSRKTPIPKPLCFYRDTNEIVTKKRVQVLGTYNENMEIELGKRVLPGETTKYQVFGQEKIVFRPEEVTTLKNIMEPGMHLLGFKSSSKISIHNFLKTSSFIYPDETKIKGSTCIFRALWQKCLEKDKVAICILTLRRKCAPRYVALIPQDDEKNASNDLVRHNGFRLFYLPCESNIRNINVFEKKAPNVTNEEVEIFQKIVKKLKFKYNPSQFENPMLKTLYSNIEALVFNLEEEEKVNVIEDSTLPNIERQDDKINPLLDQITQIFGEDFKIVEKRPATGGVQSRAKIPRTNDGGGVDDEATILSALRNGTENKLLVSVYKNYLTQKGVPGISKLNKTALIQLVRERHGL